VTRAIFQILGGAVLVAAPFVLLGQTRATPPQTKASKAKPPAKAKPAAAPAPAPQPTAFPLESLRFEGNLLIPTPRAIAASGLNIGQSVQKSDFDEARDRLIATGAFENAGYEYKPSAAGTGYDVVFQVIEVPQLFGYRFEDVPVPDETLRAALRQLEPVFDDKIPPSAAVLGRFAAAIKQASGVDVVGRLTPELPGEPTILFRPNLPRANIAEVRFTGNQVLPSTLLTRSLSAVAVGVPYTEAGFRQMLDASLRPLYEARGRIRVAFPKVSTEKAEKVDGLVVTIAVSEGSAYRLGEVRWEGVAEALLPQVEKAADFKKGDVANFDDIQAGVNRVHERYLSGGFLKQTARVERDIRDQELIVNLSVKVDPGPQYFMGKFAINGLDILSEPFIRKMWQLETGKPFQAQYPEAFLARVRNEDLFDNLGRTRAETQVNEATRTVDVTLYFSGAAADRAKDAKGKGRLR
jgi:outer membrane protein insertion porin family